MLMMLPPGPRRCPRRRPTCQWHGSRFSPRSTDRASSSGGHSLTSGCQTGRRRPRRAPPPPRIRRPPASPQRRPSGLRRSMASSSRRQRSCRRRRARARRPAPRSGSRRTRRSLVQAMGQHSSSPGRSRESWTRARSLFAVPRMEELFFRRPQFACGKRGARLKERRACAVSPPLKLAVMKYTGRGPCGAGAWQHTGQHAPLAAGLA
mmetsp:Transcript_123463/g.354740  ORF Transcript_123463/g.354740 Transcript_123463/m.354740 type:complete len:207 (-) Transcript_123463:267-887(-)